IGAVAIADLFRRWPWLIAVGTLACAPARIPVHVGSTDSNLLLPLYAGVVRGAHVLRLQRSLSAPRCCSASSSFAATRDRESSARWPGRRRRSSPGPA